LIKSTFLKVTGATFIETDSLTLISSLILSMSTFLSINFLMQKINTLKVKAEGIAQNCHIRRQEDRRQATGRQATVFACFLVACLPVACLLVASR
jgi:hypothetical protein